MALATPAVVRWAIDRPCPLRDIEDWTSPQRTESLLRAIRAARSAQLEQRVMEGICVAPLNSSQPVQIDQVKAFQQEEVFAVFGGQEQVQEQCGGCQANALADQDAGAMGGCYGWLPTSNRDYPADESDLRDLLEKAGSTVKGLAACLPQTRPCWYGLWIEPVLENQALVALEKLLTAAAAILPRPRPDLELLLAAIRRCRQHQLRLHVDLVPAGSVDGTEWSIHPHCQRCHAGWIENPLACHACGCERRPAPARQRRARGDRPYWHLHRFLGTKKGTEFLQRYLARKGTDDVQPGKRAGQDRSNEAD